MDGGGPPLCRFIAGAIDLAARHVVVGNVPDDPQLRPGGGLDDPGGVDPGVAPARPYVLDEQAHTKLTCEITDGRKPLDDARQGVTRQLPTVGENWRGVAETLHGFAAEAEDPYGWRKRDVRQVSGDIRGPANRLDVFGVLF